jgi:hypothetical protein
MTRRAQSPGKGLLRHKVRADLGVRSAAKRRAVEEGPARVRAVKPNTLVSAELENIERGIQRLIDCAPLRAHEAEQIRFHLRHALDHVGSCRHLLTCYQDDAQRKVGTRSQVALTPSQKSILIMISRKGTLSINLIDSEVEPLRTWALIKVRAGRASLTAKGRLAIADVMPAPPPKTTKEGLF